MRLFIAQKHAYDCFTRLVIPAQSHKSETGCEQKKPNNALRSTEDNNYVSCFFAVYKKIQASTTKHSLAGIVCIAVASRGVSG